MQCDFDYYDNHDRVMFFMRWKSLGSDLENEVWKYRIPRILGLYSQIVFGLNFDRGLDHKRGPDSS